jgi:predicted kinase
MSLLLKVAEKTSVTFETLECNCHLVQVRERVRERERESGWCI